MEPSNEFSAVIYNVDDKWIENSNSSNLTLESAIGNFESSSVQNYSDQMFVSDQRRNSIANIELSSDENIINFMRPNKALEKSSKFQFRSEQNLFSPQINHYADDFEQELHSIDLNNSFKRLSGFTTITEEDERSNSALKQKFVKLEDEMIELETDEFEKAENFFLDNKYCSLQNLSTNDFMFKDNNVRSPTYALSTTNMNSPISQHEFNRSRLTNETLNDSHQKNNTNYSSSIENISQINGSNLRYNSLPRLKKSTKPFSSIQDLSKESGIPISSEINERNKINRRNSFSLEMTNLSASMMDIRSNMNNNDKLGEPIPKPKATTLRRSNSKIPKRRHTLSYHDISGLAIEQKTSQYNNHNQLGHAKPVIPPKPNLISMKHKSASTHNLMRSVSTESQEDFENKKSYFGCKVRKDTPNNGRSLSTRKKVRLVSSAIYF